jgi:hypothetical protein
MLCDAMLCYCTLCVPVPSTTTPSCMALCVAYTCAKRGQGGRAGDGGANTTRRAHPSAARGVRVRVCARVRRVYDGASEMRRPVPFDTACRSSRAFAML